MKILTIAVIAGLLIIAGFVVVNALQFEEVTEENVISTGCGSCSGVCSLEAGCSSPKCGINTEFRSCGCRG